MSKRFVAYALLLAAGTISGETLDEVVARAVARSPEVRAAQAAVDEARAAAVLADAFRPSASIALTPAYSTSIPLEVVGQMPAIGTIEAHRLLFDRSARMQELTAESEVTAAAARLEEAKRGVAQRTAELLARIDADAAMVRSGLRRSAAFETIASRAAALQQEGRARELDVSRTALQVARAKRQLLQAQNRLDLDRLRYVQLTGEQPTNIDRGATPPAEGDTVAQAKAADPELRALDARLESMRSASTLLHRPFLPTVSAQIQYARLFDRFGRYYSNFRPDDFSVGASISLPLWRGGQAAASARVTAQMNELAAQRDARAAAIENSVREAEADLAQATAEDELASRTVAVAEDALRIAKALQAEGRGDANDVQTAEAAVADAMDDAASAHAHLAIARAHLQVVRGDLPRRE